MERALGELAARWRRYWPDADADAIAADARERFAAALAAWELDSPQPLPGGVVGLTCAAGDRVVKVLPRLHPEVESMRGEGEALAHWSPTAACPELLDQRDDGMTLLMRRVQPGTTLDDAALRYDDQLDLVGSLVRSLHAAGPPPETMPSLAAYVEPYRRVRDDALQSELDALLSGGDAPVAVHADLHGGNVLRAGSHWVAIDPKGVRGDRHLDVWLLLCPQAPALPEGAAEARAEARRRVVRYASAAGLDAERAAAWVRTIALAEARLSAYSAFSGWTARLRRLATALAA